jgi:predicted GNAT family N-acyltransferase
MTLEISPVAFAVRLVEWSEAEAALQSIRRAVFIVEQRIPEDLEWDEFDRQSRHALAVDTTGSAVGCGRLMPDGHIGRLAVLRAWRGRGVGSALLEALVELARSRGHARTLLNSQTQAMPFYARHGFVAVGDETMEAGIAHREMARDLR